MGAVFVTSATLRQVQITAEVDLEQDWSMFGQGNVPGLCSDAREDRGRLAGQVAEKPSKTWGKRSW